MCCGGAFEALEEDALWEFEVGAEFSADAGAALADDVSAGVFELLAGAADELFAESDVLAAGCAGLLFAFESDGEDACAGATSESFDALACCAACVFR